MLCVYLAPVARMRVSTKLVKVGKFAAAVTALMSIAGISRSVKQDENMVVMLVTLDVFEMLKR